MEAASEIFDNLSESQKRKFLFDKLNLLEHTAIDTPSSKRGCEESLLQGCSEGDPKKKQKTLDSWLIKSDGSKQKKIDKLPCNSTKPKNSSSFDRSSVVENNSQCISEGSEKVSTSNSFHTVLDKNDTSGDSKNVSDEIVTGKSNVKDDSCDTKANKVVLEKYNLRSKRILSKSTKSTSPELQGEVNSYNHSKNVSSSDNNCKVNSHNQVSRNSKASECSEDIAPSKVIKISKTKQTDLNQDTSNHMQCTEETICHNNEIIPLDKKAQKGSGTKGKRKLNESNVENSSNNSASDGLINQLIIQPQVDEDVGTASLQSNYKAYCKLNLQCSEIGLNLVDLVNHEKIKNLLSDEKNSKNETVVFIGTFNSSTGNILPVVHQIQSKRKLLESLQKLQKTSS